MGGTGVVGGGDVGCTGADGAAATSIVRVAFDVSAGELESIAVTPKE